jgi:hypothetical protein
MSFIAPIGIVARAIFDPIIWDIVRADGVWQLVIRYEKTLMAYRQRTVISAPTWCT